MPVPSTVPPICANEEMDALTELKFSVPASTSSKWPKLAAVVIESVPPPETSKLSSPTERLATLTEGEARS